MEAKSAARSAAIAAVRLEGVIAAIAQASAMLSEGMDPAGALELAREWAEDARVHAEEAKAAAEAGR